VSESFVSRSQYDQLVADLRLAESQLERARLSIGEAAEKGDLSENAEYDAAREAEQFFLARVAQLRERVNNVRILDRKIDFSGEIGIGTRCVIKDIKTGEEETYTIVGDGSFDFSRGELPYTSPFGSGLCGRKAGDEVVIQVPAGKLHYKVLSVEMVE